MHTFDRTNSSPRKHRWVVWLLVTQAALCIALGLSLSIPTAVFVLRAARSTGQIVGFNQIGTGQSNRLYEAVFSYSDGQGIVRTQRSSGMSYSRPLPGHPTVVVLYDPTDPGHAEIGSFRQLGVAPVAFLLGGVMTIAMACVVRWFLTRAETLRVPHQSIYLRVRSP